MNSTDNGEQLQNQTMTQEYTTERICTETGNVATKERFWLFSVIPTGIYECSECGADVSNPMSSHHEIRTVKVEEEGEQ